MIRRAKLLVTLLSAAVLLAGLADRADARRQRCRRRDKLVKLKYTHGGQVWIPRRISCGGTAPVIILLHGNNKSLDRHPSLGGGRHLEKLVSKYVRGRMIWPVVLAEPIHHGTCSKRRGGLPAVFGQGFSFKVYRKRLTRLLRKHGIRVRSWSVMAHSGSGCCPGAGIFAAVKAFGQLYLYATSDTCYGSPFYANFALRHFLRKRTRVVNTCRGVAGYPAYKRYEKTLIGKQYQRCGHIDRRYYKRCRKRRGKHFYAYVTKPTTVQSHNQVFKEIVKTLLFKFFRRRVRRRHR
jgi:hypothetical protein